MSEVPFSQLPAPDVVEELDFETLLAEYLDDFVRRQREHDPAYERPRESDPVYQVFSIVAYREMLLRGHINDSARAIMLAYAAGADLDQLAVFYGVQRIVVREADPDADPPIEQILETDEAFLRRMRLSLRGLSVAGPADAYIFHALSASGDVLDATAAAPEFEFVRYVDAEHVLLRVIDDAGLARPMPNHVAVSILSRLGNGVPDQALIDTVQAAIAADSVRPLTDRPLARAASIVTYQIDATLYFDDGPDRAVVRNAAIAAARSYTEESRRLGVDIARSAIYAALHQPGVRYVDLRLPAEPLIEISDRETGYCSALDVADGGVYA